MSKSGSQPPTLQGFREGPALGQVVEKALKRFAERGGGRIAFDLFQRRHDADAGGGELGKLMIELGPLVELAGREDDAAYARAGSGRDAVEAGS